MSDKDEKRIGESPTRQKSEAAGTISSEKRQNADDLQRRLHNRQIQLIAIGGSIGTALFISIGNGLAAGGPASLFIAYTLYSCVIGLINNCIAEMSTLQPVSGGFIRLAGLWVDDAFGFMAGWNFFLYEALLIPFEITALTVVLSYWNPAITTAGPTAGIAAGCIICYALSLGRKKTMDFRLINVLAVKGYGEAEFWLSGGKVILIFMLFGFTLVSMCGGNPQHDAYGFRNWSIAGAFAARHSTGDLGRFEGFLACLWNASFCVVGPEYISMVAAEAIRPRKYIKNAFKTVYWRFGLFFILGSLCVGIVVRWDDPVLQDIKNGVKSSGTAAASPYVIAMTNMGVQVFPHIVNALIFTSIFSAGNTYTYCASRSLYGLALEGRAPHFLTKVDRRGVPLYAFGIVMLFPLLSFLQVSSNSSKVLTWLVNLVTAGGIINYIVISTTYIFFYKACQAQGVDRRTFPYTGWFQPYSAYIGLVFEGLVLFFYGYSSFQPWDVSTFFTYYAMVIVAPLLFIGWKLAHKTRFIKPLEADLVYQRPLIDAYEASFTSPPIGFWTELLRMVGFRRNTRQSDEREMIRPGSA